MPSPTIAAALVCEPALIAGVRLVGLAVAAALLVFAVDTARRIVRAEGIPGGPRRCESGPLPSNAPPRS